MYLWRDILHVHLVLRHIVLPKFFFNLSIVDLQSISF